MRVTTGIQISEEKAEATAAAIERRLAKALEHLGKVSLRKRGGGFDRSTTVTKAGASINVVVRHEHSGGFRNRPTGLYSVLVQEVRGADSRIKHRARDFKDLPAQPTLEQIERIVACVAKHLATGVKTKRELKTRDAEREAAEQERADRYAGLKAIGKDYGITSSDYGTMLGNGFKVTCEGDTFTVTLERIPEAELRRFLDWRTKQKKTR